ncbi:MAG TPA: potassium-transporting ATPase subunit KdpA [Anaeromyxobacteraceae bacterium]|nr:potassium-transporting ATPase subunit KdpA [Anaeromyxobacteraceae bacterium]
MTLNGWLEIGLFAIAILLVTKPVGLYLHRVYEGDRQPLPRILGPVERLLYRLSGVDPSKEQDWKGYAIALLVFSLFGVLGTYLILRLQAVLPLNPNKMAAVAPDLALNTAASFTTNTNWQSYSGESTMSYLAQMAGLAWHNFTSAAVGVGVALALARGLTRRPGPGGPRTIGNFWVDLVRGILYVFLPVSFVAALFFVSQGVVQTLAPNLEVQGLEGVKQVITLGPVASQEAIKMFGTNGGGFFNANSAHPFENPTPFSDFVQLVLIFAVPAGLTYTFGKMARDTRQGWALFASMAFLFLAGVVVAYAAESRPNPALAGLAVDSAPGNTEGKEVRFGIAESALFATVTTDASCGAVNSMHDSFTPLGGLVPLVNMQLGEVIFGGVGAGLYGMLVMAVLTVFIAGLMVGRTPEYLGKKIEGKEMKLAVLYILVFPLVVLTLAGWSSVVPYGTSSLNNSGPHGLSELLYAFTSGAANNGSAFAGLNANTKFWNLALAADMLVGRFLMIIPALGIAGAMLNKKSVAAGPGTFPTDGPTFVALLVSVVAIVGALTFFPALSLGPVLEHFAALHGKLF